MKFIGYVVIAIGLVIAMGMHGGMVVNSLFRINYEQQRNRIKNSLLSDEPSYNAVVTAVRRTNDVGIHYYNYNRKTGITTVSNIDIEILREIETTCAALKYPPLTIVVDFDQNKVVMRYVLQRSILFDCMQIDLTYWDDLPSDTSGEALTKNWLMEIFGLV